MKVALLVLDMQKKYRDESSAGAAVMKKAAAYLAYAIKQFEARGLPVFHVLHNEGGKPEALQADDFWELDEVAAQDRAQVIIKQHGSAFIGTELEARLKSAGVDFLVLGGLAAEWCVLNTVRHGEDLGWKIALLRDGLASANPERIPFVESINEVISIGALLAVLGK